MKKAISIIVSLFFMVMLQGQVYKTINVTAGGLSSALPEAEKSTITNLTITGSIDARDFKTMRDNIPNLAVIDISKVTISAYTGIDGTGVFDEYLSDDIPDYAFSLKTSLKSIFLPNSLTSIESNSFNRCGITSISIPSSVGYIGIYAFQESDLKSISFIPDSEFEIQGGTFDLCYQLDSVYLGKNISAIAAYAFGYCINLKTFVINCIDPTKLQISPDAFSYTQIANCYLYVPCGSSEKYDTAIIWKDFKEISEIKVSSNLVYIGAIEGSLSKIKIESNKSWTTISDQVWLKVSPLEGINNDSISFFTEANPTFYSRKAKVTITESSGCKKTITIIQLGVPLNLNVTPGDLSSLLSNYDRKNITNLTLAGTIDARDFKTLRDSMPVLAFLDLSNTKIVSYEGLNGPLFGYERYYMADVIPEVAFMGSHLISIKLPNTAGMIDFRAFEDCRNLNTVFIPESIEIINFSFLVCINLTRLYVFKSLPPYADGAFEISSKTTCKLYVPYGTKELYAAANEWQEFINIIEMPGFKPSATAITLAAKAGSEATVILTSNVTWTATSNEGWLSASPKSGNIIDTLTFTATVANTLATSRIALVTISATGIAPQTITITQLGVPVIVNNIAGGLSSALSPLELSTISSLALTGTIDARDFITMRDNMPSLSKVDLSGATISGYNDYPANEVPYYAFYGKTSLTSIILPMSVKAIGYHSFFGCSRLYYFTIPPSVNTIDDGSFKDCISLRVVSIPPSVNKIGHYAFQGCIGLRSIYVYSSNPIDLRFSSYVFEGPNPWECKLYVPFGSKERYSTAYQWQAFSYIEEMSTDFSVESAGTISGVSTICQGQQGVSYSIPPITDVTDYIWGYTGTGASISSNSNTSNPIISFNVEATSGNLIAMGINSFGFAKISTVYPVTVNQLSFVTNSVLPSANPVCIGTSVIFTATPTNGGTTPAYQWKKNGTNVGTNSPEYSYIPVSNDVISCELTSNATCTSGSPAKSNAVTMTVNQIPNQPTLSLKGGDTIHSDAPIGNQWYNKNIEIPGATNQDYIASPGGDYYVIVSLNGCSSEPSEHILNVGFDMNEKNRILKIYPNPVTNDLTIEIKGNTRSTDFKILNSLGQVVYKANIEEEAVVQTSNFYQGVYIIKLEDGRTIKFIKIMQ